MADGITLERRVEVIDGRQTNVFELTIDASLAPSRSSTRTFTVLHQAAPVIGKPRAAPVALAGVRAVGMSSAVVSTIGAAPPPLEDDPLLSRWLVSAPADDLTGELIFRGEWVTRKDGSTTRFEQRVPAGTELNKDEVEILLETAIPQIGARINEVTPQVSSSSASDENGKAIEVLKHVQRLLDDGLAPIWASIEGLPTKDGVPLMAADPDELEPEELEECWAQLLSERLVGTPYAGPGVNHFGSSKGDDTLFKKVLDDADPAFPIIYACQHLCTAAGVSRGFENAADHPIDARSAGGVQSWGDDARVLTGGQATPNAQAVRALANDVLKPAISFVANDVAHVAFVLRAFKAGRLQLIDTGGMLTDPKVVTPFGTAGAVETSSALTLGGLNFDTQLVTAIARPLKQIGIPPTAPALAGALKRMKRARPLGVARCLLLERLTDGEAKGKPLEERLRFASPLVPMWFRDQNYSILRLLWSMRSHPHADQFEVRWWVAFPQHDVATAMLSSRAFSWDVMEAAAKQRKTAARSLLHPAVYLGSLASGQVRFVGRFSTKSDGKVTFSTWFDSVQNKTFKPPDSNAIAPTLKERGLPLETPVGVAGGERPKGFGRLMNLDKAQVPEYLSTVVGG